MEHHPQSQVFLILQNTEMRTRTHECAQSQDQNVAQHTFNIAMLLMSTTTCARRWLEKHWITRDGFFQIFTTVLGIYVVDCWYGY